MANFKVTMDLEAICPKGLSDENLALEMIKAGQEVMQKSIQKAAQKHIKTGVMAKSVNSSKPLINRAGDAVGRVKFYGKDKNGMQNWSKALWLEFGTKNQSVQPFVRPAIKSCENSIRTAMQRVFDRQTRGKN